MVEIFYRCQIYASVLPAIKWLVEFRFRYTDKDSLRQDFVWINFCIEQVGDEPLYAGQHSY